MVIMALTAVSTIAAIMARLSSSDFRVRFCSVMS